MGTQYLPAFGEKNTYFQPGKTSCICQGMEKLSVRTGTYQSSNYWPKSLDISFQKGGGLYTVPKYFKKVFQKTGLKSKIKVETGTTMSTALINRTSPASHWTLYTYYM